MLNSLPVNIDTHGTHLKWINTRSSYTQLKKEIALKKDFPSEANSQKQLPV